VPFYINNFLNFPVGTAVPVGYYNKDKAAWVPSDNGKVIKILTTNNSIAEIDSNGDNIADDATTLSALGITDQERTQLATLYTVGQTLWRVQVSHLSTWDCNWPYKMPDDAVQPQTGQPKNELTQSLNSGTGTTCPTSKINPKKSTIETNSIVECENQTLRESISITGSGQELNYASNRVPARKSAYTLNIPLSGQQLPNSIKRIDLIIDIAGRRFEQSFPATINQSFNFTWDGLDTFNRRISGTQTATVRIGYVYDPVYATPAQLSTAFAQFSGVPLEGSSARNEVRIFNDHIATIGLPDVKTQDAGGWSLTSHYRYDPIGRMLYMGNGSRQAANAVAAGGVISKFAGGLCSTAGDGGLATQAGLGNVNGLSAASDGSVFIMDGSTGANRVRKVSPDGIISTFAGNGQIGFSGDGGPATQATFGVLGPTHGSIGPDGSLYVVDLRNGRIRKIDTNGVINTVAGNGQVGFSGDGGSATLASLNLLNGSGLAIAPDGSLYISDSGNDRIRKVTLDGNITTIAGTGVGGFSGDGGPASQARLNSPSGIAIASDGSLYIADSANRRIRKVSPDGIISTVAGNGLSASTGDGGNALQASLIPNDIAVGPDDSLIIVETNNRRIRRVRIDGIISTIAGGGTTSIATANGNPATGVNLQSTVVAINQTGNILADSTCTVHKISSVFNGFTGGQFLYPSEDGSVVYSFNTVGRHISTLNALTGATLQSFSYDTAGNLTKITDAEGLVTTIERDTSGNAAAIVAPFGQRTTLTLGVNGYLAKATNPVGEAHEMTYTADGLLTSFKDPRGNASTFQYDTLGRLLKDTNAATGSLSLARNELSDGYDVTVTSGLNRAKKHTVRNLATGDRERTHLQPDNTSSNSLEKTDGTIATNAADGSITTLTEDPDPRFSMLAPIPQSYTFTSGGHTLNSTSSRTVTLASADNPLSLTSLTDTATINGRTSRLVFNQAAKTFTSTSAANRQSTALIDNLGRTLRTTVTGINPVNNTYDPQGRPATLAQGTGVVERLVNFTYNPQGFLANVTDPLARQAKYEYDLAGRVTKQILPDNREILFTYDAKGNLTSLLPPGRPAHSFTHSSIDQVLTYVPPPVSGSGNNSTSYEYDLDKALTKITRPDLLTINFSYDTAGRLNKLTTPEGDTNFSYIATTGKLTSIAAPGGESLAYTYNGALLTQTAWSGTLTGNVGYAYDNDFRVNSISVNGGNPFTYQYDSDSLLTSVSNTAVGINFTLARNTQNGLLTGTVLGSVNDTYTYNGFAEMTNYLAKFGTTDLYNTVYTRDKLGRITRKVETVGGVSHTYDYAYDLAGRLTEVKQDNLVQESYGYDDNGNRTFLNGSPIADYDAQDRLLRYNNITYGYTANGELKTKTIGTATTSYNYDVLVNLRNVTLTTGTSIDYVIDGQNRRIGKKRNGVLEQGFLYQSHLKPIAELDGQGNIVARFVYGIGVNVPDFMVKGGVTYRFIKDHLGSPRLVVNTATNTVAQRMDYDAWGNVLVDSNPGFQPFGFAGGIYDRDTGLVRYGARDYDAVVGRWLCKNTSLFSYLGSNLFLYSHNDPINFIDFNGHQETSTSVNKKIKDNVKWGAEQVTEYLVEKGSEAYSSLSGAALKALNKFRGAVKVGNDVADAVNQQDAAEERKRELERQQLKEKSGPGGADDEALYNMANRKTAASFEHIGTAIHALCKSVTDLFLPPIANPFAGS
jgi:RHS repeat-associated protein